MLTHPRSRAVALVAGLVALVAPAFAHAAPPPSKERRVLTQVHTDAVAVFYETGALVLGTRADVDDEHGKRLDPALTLFNLEEAAKRTVPAATQYGFLGQPGADVWIAPQNNPGGTLLWPGFSTEGVAAGILDGDDLTFGLEKLEGPGTVDLYEVDGFGGVTRLLSGDGQRSWTRKAGQHIHANWAFSARGRYVLRFTVRASIAGAPVSASREYTFHVGDVPAPVSTSTTLSASTTTATVGHPVTLTAAVAPPGAKGWVEFLDGAESLGWSAVADGSAALTTSSLTLGAHDLTARFTPEWTNDFTTSRSDALRVDVAPDPGTGVLRIDGKASYATGETMRLRAAGASAGAGETFRWWYVVDGETHLYPLFDDTFTPAAGPEFALELSQAVDGYSFVVQLLAEDGTVLKQSAPFDARVSGPSVGTGLPVTVGGFKSRYEAGEYAELHAAGTPLPAGHRYRWITRSALFPVSVRPESEANWRFLASSLNGAELYVQILDAAGAVVGQSPYVTVAADAYTLRIEREPRDFYRAGETLELQAALTPDNGRFTRYEWLQNKAGSQTWEPIAGSTTRTLRLPLTEADHNSSFYVRLLEDEGTGVAAQSSTLRIDVVPASGGQTFFLKQLAGHYHSGGQIRLEAVADPLPAGASFRWFFKRADETAYRQLAFTGAAHTLRASQSLDGAKVYAQLLDGAGAVVAETPASDIHVDDHGAGPNESIAIAGLAPGYRPGEPVSLQAVVAPGVELDRYEWAITRRGGATERYEGPAVAFDADPGLDGAVVRVKLLKNTGETYLESAPVTLAVAAREDVRVGGTVRSVLALRLGAATDLGTFVPGVARTYAATAAAEVTTSLRGVTLTVRDPEAEAPGRLVNGGEALRQPLRVSAGEPFAPLPADGSPVPLLAFPRAVSGHTATIAFEQAIEATEPLDAGGYGKTLTFTLAPASP